MQRNMNRIIHPTEWNKEESTQTPAEDSQGKSRLRVSGFYSYHVCTEAPQPQLANSTTGFQSEHGHNLAAVAPMTKHSGNSVVTFFNGLFTTIIGIATLGARLVEHPFSSSTALPTFLVSHLSVYGLTDLTCADPVVGR